MESIGKLVYELNSTPGWSKLDGSELHVSVIRAARGPGCHHEPMYRAVAGRATMTLRVLLRAGRRCRLADYV